jgi:L-arabinonolactonase
MSDWAENVSPCRLEDGEILTPTVARLGQMRGVFGESAVWSAADQGVWWVDMHGHALIFSGIDGASRYWKAPGPQMPWVRAVVLREAGGLIVALSDILAAFDPASGIFTPLPIAFDMPQGHVFNDATVDPQGRLIIGTMLPGRGNDGRARFYRIEADRSVSILLDGFNTTNGLAFSPSGRTLYFSDSHADSRRVWELDYDPVSGATGTARPFIDFAGLPGKPDGAAVDRDGGYWLAAMASPYLHRFSPAGELLASVLLPVDTPTRPVFGGPDLQTLYVTTGGLRHGEIDDGWKGSVLALPSSVAGLPPAKARL